MVEFATCKITALRSYTEYILFKYEPSNINHKYNGDCVEGYSRPLDYVADGWRRHYGN